MVYDSMKLGADGQLYLARPVKGLSAYVNSLFNIKSDWMSECHLYLFDARQKTTSWKEFVRVRQMHLFFNADYFRHCNLNLYTSDMRWFLKWDKMDNNKYTYEEVKSLLDSSLTRTYTSILCKALDRFRLNN